MELKSLYSSRIGNIQLSNFEITELDGGDTTNTVPTAVERQLAIVVPCMNDDCETLEGVLSGIPNACLTVVVSNSNNSNYDAERRSLEALCSSTQRQGIICHQGDPGIAESFHAAGLPSIVFEDSMRVRNGKGEAMMIGVMLARRAKKQFIGFIDADNLVAATVLEYCRAYVAGIQATLQPIRGCDSTTRRENVSTIKIHTMVRIEWRSKAQAKNDRIVLRESGRSSAVVNEWMNELWRSVGGAPPNTIRTSNAGEHAMDIDLALNIPFASGFAVEPNQIVDILEQFVGPTHADAAQASHCTTAFDQHQSGPYASTPHVCNHLTSRGAVTERLGPASCEVRISQVKTRSPHIHNTNRGDRHISEMVVAGLSTIYHSLCASPELKAKLINYLRKHYEDATTNGSPIKPLVYRPLRELDWKAFNDRMATLDSIVYF
jgi:mannosyl-3-phosphoglycerate synthase